MAKKKASQSTSTTPSGPVNPSQPPPAVVKLPAQSTTPKLQKHTNGVEQSSGSKPRRKGKRNADPAGNPTPAISKGPSIMTTPPTHIPSAQREQPAVSSRPAQPNAATTKSTLPSSSSEPRVESPIQTRKPSYWARRRERVKEEKAAERKKENQPVEEALPPHSTSTTPSTRPTTPISPPLQDSQSTSNSSSSALASVSSKNPDCIIRPELASKSPPPPLSQPLEAIPMDSSVNDISPECADSSPNLEREICRYYLWTGLCQFGYACRYLHVPRDVVSEEVTPLKRSVLDAPAPEFCKMYMRGQECWRGKYCRFGHPPHTKSISDAQKTLIASILEATVPVVAPPSVEAVSKPEPVPSSSTPIEHEKKPTANHISEELCRDNLKRRCKRGANCPYSHGQEQAHSTGGSTTPSTTSAPTPPISKDNETCRDNITGRCQRGDDCPCDHGTPKPSLSTETTISSTIPPEAPPMSTFSSQSTISPLLSVNRLEETMHPSANVTATMEREQPVSSEDGSVSDSSWWSAQYSWADRLSEEDDWSSSPSSAGPSTPQLAQATSAHSFEAHDGPPSMPHKVEQDPRRVHQISSVSSPPLYPPGIFEPRTPTPTRGHAVGPRLAHSLPPRAEQPFDVHPPNGPNPRHPQVAPPNYPICHEWASTRHCKWGPQCKFPHVVPRPAPLVHEHDTPEPVGFSSLDVCLEWMQGKCKHANCKYRHPTTAAVTAEPEDPQIRHHRVGMPSQIHVCLNFLRGYCYKGYACKRKHIQDATSSLAPRFPKFYKPGPDAVPIEVPGCIEVKYSSGFKVKEIMTAFDSGVISVSNIPVEVPSFEIQKALRPFGCVKFTARTVVDVLTSRQTVTAAFATMEKAVNTVAVLNGAHLWGTTISVKLLTIRSEKAAHNLSETAVRLTWDQPVRMGYAGYETKEQARAIVARVHGTVLKSAIVEAEIYEGLPTIGFANVRFWLPPMATEKDMHQFGQCEGIMMDRPNYMSLSDTALKLRSTLEDFGELESFRVLPPPYKNHKVRAWAMFVTPEAAKSATRGLDRQKRRWLGVSPLTAEYLPNLEYSVSPEQYRLARADIDELARECRDKGGLCNVATFFIPTPVVKISAPNMKMLVNLKQAFESTLHGQTVKLDGEIAWDDHFTSRSGRDTIEGIEKLYPGVSISVDALRRKLTVRGPLDRRRNAAADIVATVLRQREYQTTAIPLPGNPVAFLVSPELDKLVDELGRNNVVLNLQKRVLAVCGGPQVVEAAQLAVLRTSHRYPVQRNFEVAECPACCNDVSAPVALECGHTWCKRCLVKYLLGAVSDPLFPLVCFGSDGACDHPIPVSLARELLPADQFDALARASFLAYIHARPDEFHHCPTPDCEQVYRTVPPNTVLQCPSCFTRICGKCNKESHNGEPCNDAQEELFQEWTATHDVKNCPGCKVPIERSAGCNHMTCVRCQTHICWVCLKTFNRGEGIYDHMRAEHGGIGL